MPTVAIAGGGPAGAAAALVLARRGVSVTVFERSREPSNKIGDCLPPSFTPLLDRLDLSAQIAAGPHLRTYGNCSVWGTDQAVEHDFISEPYGAGWRLDRKSFESTLASAAISHGVRWQYGATVSGC